MDIAEELRAIEQIKALKARYWRGIDTRDRALLRGVFTDDAITDFRDSTQSDDDTQLKRNPDAFVDDLFALLNGVVTVHHGHSPEIALRSETEATGIWPMEDWLWVEDEASSLPFRKLNGWGHYHDTYRKTAIGWRIASTKLVRIRVEAE
ncbi:nuclear transport factor 2 family protein [Flavisphingomonas formosensis]|uniref:nuclear transport factor 2 family protein n=1 Tax=Flavisphingomonas formosensis TaxID=861534 RepID=UPI0012FCFA08|nr:nuclear transport factor 2 family protein [Sphingomonas formosensis]